MNPLRYFLTLSLVICPFLGARAGETGDFAQRWFDAAVAAEKAGKADEAKAAYVRVLEREPRHLPALVALTRLDRGAQRTDEALDWAGRFLGTWRWLQDKPPALVDAHKELAAYALEADPERKRADALKRDYVTKLLKLANEQLDNHAYHSGRAMLLEAQATDPEHPELAAGLARIKKEGGNELAVADEGGGVDPLAGVTPEWVALNDPKHVEWDKAWELETEHYKIKTNAGYRVLKTTARAMEQVQVFYRIFHQYKTKGESIPVANVHIFKNAEEYTKLGNKPVEWAAGHWDGTNVVTYDAREGGEGGLGGMLDTLFHEASHQFTTLAGGSGVPSWLNEGMASFFEGTKLLSNGKLDWNLVVPYRLGPLLQDLSSATPNKIENVIEGKVEDYRVNYPWGWGIVYYLYNAEDANSGRLLYRSLMKEYFQGYGGEKHLERFVEFFVTKAKVEGVASIGDFEKRFKDYVFGLEAQERGQVDLGRLFEERADKQMKLKDFARAAELYERSLERDGDHPEVLWKLAGALEKINAGDRAAGMLRRFLGATTVAADAVNPNAARRAEAEARILKDDTSAKRLTEMRLKFHADAITLAKDYDKKGFPRLALRALRGPATATPPSAEGRTLYFAISDRSGVSLESWRLLFDERTLKGFYGDPDEAAAFKVEKGVITSEVTDLGGRPGVGRLPSTGESRGSGSAARKDDTFAFKKLFVDVEPAGDWSLEAEVQLEADGRLAGLCFGKKEDSSFTGIAILPEGYVDLAAFVGSVPKTLVRLKHAIAPGWHRLRMEVAGTRLVASLDGKQVLEYEFASRAELRGDFGLLAGLGKSNFKEIKLLEFDPSLPRRTAIGRRKAATDVTAEANTPLARAEAGLMAYRDQAPPLIQVEEWIGTPPPSGGDLEKMRGWPCVLVFWTTIQEKQVPLLAGLVALAEKHKDVALPVILVSNEPAESVREYLKTTPVPFPIAIDKDQKIYGDYALPKVQLPHAKLLGADGLVVWEGNPDYKAEYGMYLDEPTAELVTKSRLKELMTADSALARADEAFAKGDFKAAADEWRSVALIDIPNERVLRAKAGLAKCEAEARARLERAQALAGEKRCLQAAKNYEEIAAAFLGFEPGHAAKRAFDALVKTKAYITNKGHENLLKNAEKSAAAKKNDAARETLDNLMGKLTPDSDPSIKERADALLASLK